MFKPTRTRPTSTERNSKKAVAARLASAMTGLLAAAAIPLQTTSADASRSGCREAAKARFPDDSRTRKEYNRYCNIAPMADRIIVARGIGYWIHRRAKITGLGKTSMLSTTMLMRPRFSISETRHRATPAEAATELRDGKSKTHLMQHY